MHSVMHSVSLSIHALTLVNWLQMHWNLCMLFIYDVAWTALKMVCMIHQQRHPKVFWYITSYGENFLKRVLTYLCSITYWCNLWWVYIWKKIYTDTQKCNIYLNYPTQRKQNSDKTREHCVCMIKNISWSVEYANWNFNIICKICFENYSELLLFIIYIREF